MVAVIFCPFGVGLGDAAHDVICAEPLPALFAHIRLCRIVHAVARYRMDRPYIGNYNANIWWRVTAVNASVRNE
ncbi:MAG: hypothetical protein WD671_01700, partial [Parvibaculum sp.]